MTIHAIALTGLSNTAKSFRNELSALMPFATAARPTGTRSGVRVGTPVSTVSLSGLTGTVKCHSGVMDIQASVTAGPYVYAVTADETFAVTPAHATFARIDVVSIRINDTVEDGSGLETAQVVYTQGTAASTPLQPALTTTRELIIATIASPVSGGGAPVVSWVALYTVAAGGILPVRNVAERAALVAAYPATTEAPVMVWRKDASAGRQIEYTSDNSTWYVLQGNAGEWQAFAGSVTGLTMGASTLNHKYTRIGNTVMGSISLTLGTGFSWAGTGASFSLPFTPLAPMGHASANILKSGVAYYLAQTEITSGLAVFCVTPSTGSGAVITASAPFTWGVNDAINISYAIQVAAS